LCNDCHGKDGTSIADDAPILAGQFKQYIRRQFKNIASFERYIPRKMERKFKKLSDADKTALLEFYASAASK
jgi:sulfide dehydrogenase cytochrome subunit